MKRYAVCLCVILLLCGALAWRGSRAEQPTEIIIEVDDGHGQVELIMLDKEADELLPVPLPVSDGQERRESVSVFNYQQNTKSKMSASDYLICVVAAEMPASYNIEALKAQAVAARTYLERKISCGGCNYGEEICTRSGHCQAYCSPEAQHEKWGANYEKYYGKIKEAVESTAGEILMYNGTAAEALYHASSGKCTENVGDVYPNALPYLVSVESPDNVAAITVQTSYTFVEFAKIVNEKYPDAKLSEKNLQLWVRITEKTASGRIAKMQLGKKEVTGKEMRKLFSLRSTDFSVEFRSNTVYFNTVGYGHGVGMSQVGAQAYAKQGWDYKKILLHYYTGVTIEK